MGTLTFAAIAAGARRVLLDPDKVTWVDADMLAYGGQAQRAIVALKPEANPAIVQLTLVAGTHQALPATHAGLLDLYENATSKRRATKVSRSLLDAALRSWPNGTPQLDVEEWTFDPRMPRGFEVYPPNNGSGSVAAMVGVIPAQPGALTDAIALDDTFEMAIQYFMLEQAYSMNTQRQDLTKSASYRQAWISMIGGRAQSLIAVAPQTTSPGGA